MAWKVWVTTITTVLYASDLNDNMDYLSNLTTNITGGNLAADCINDGSFIDNEVIQENHLDYSDATDGIGVLQIGKDRTTHEQMLVKGTAAMVSNTAVTSTTQIVYFTNGDCCTAGEPVYTAAPHFNAWIYSNDSNIGCYVEAVATDSALLRVDLDFKGDADGSSTLDVAQVIYWEACGNI